MIAASRSVSSICKFDLTLFQITIVANGIGISSRLRINRGAQGLYPKSTSDPHIHF